MSAIQQMLLGYGATGGGGGTDPLFSLVKFGANFTGTNGATSATDFSSSGRAITFVGSTAITTSDSAFGAGSSMAFDGTGDYLTMPDSADWAVASSTDWCWEFVIKITGDIGISMDILSQATGAGAYPIRISRQAGAGGGLGALVFDSGTNLIGNLTGGSITTNAWTHIAVVSESGNLRLKIAGSHVATASIGTNALFDASDTMKIGTYNPSNSNGFLGYMQCARFTVGNARYTGTGSYTAPSALFPTS